MTIASLARRSAGSVMAGTLAWLLLAALASPAFAQAGTLDTTFGGDGKVTTNFTSGDDWPWDVALQADGKIVAAGAAQGQGGRFALVRYNPDGTVDTTFNRDGKVTTNFTSGWDIATGVAVQSDGKIVAAGYAAGQGGRFALARYNLNGTLDSSFSADGKLVTNFTSGSDFAWDVAIQADGKIVAAGRASGQGGRFAFVRYNLNGTLDSSFSGDGRLTTNFTSGNDGAAGVAIQADGKIVAAGWAAGGQGGRFALARYNPDGSPDTTFSGDGRLTTNFTSGHDGASHVAIQADGKIVAAGGAAGQGGRFALARYNPDGSPDTTFSGDGSITTNFTSGEDWTNSVAIQADGKIVAAGYAAGQGGRFALARYNPGGNLDTTFSGDGRLTTNFTSGQDVATGAAIQADGKIVAAGWAAGQGGRFAVARYLAD